MLLLIFLSTGCATAPRGRHDTEAKIAFYRQRVDGPGTYPAYAQLGLAYLDHYRETGRIQEYRKALDALQQSLAYQPNFEALLGMARTLSERHYFSNALPYAESAVAAFPSSVDAVGVLFDIQLALGDASLAQATLAKVTTDQPLFEVLSRQAALLEYRGDFPGALVRMTAARDAAKSSQRPELIAWAEVRVGALQVLLCQAEAACSSYQRALDLVPNYYFAKEHLAEWHAARGEWAQAQNLYRELLEVRPETSYRIGLAECLRQQGELRAAEREEREAVSGMRRSVRDGSQDQLRPLALLLLSRSESVEEGLHLAQRDWAIRQDALAADTLAWGCFCVGQTNQAIKLSERARQSGSRWPGLLLHSGIILYSAGKETSGLDLLREALQCPLAFGPYERSLAASAERILDRDRVKASTSTFLRSRSRSQE